MVKVLWNKIPKCFEFVTVSGDNTVRAFTRKPEPVEKLPSGIDFEDFYCVDETAPVYEGRILIEGHEYVRLKRAKAGWTWQTSMLTRPVKEERKEQ